MAGVDQIDLEPSRLPRWLSMLRARFGWERLVEDSRDSNRPKNVRRSPIYRPSRSRGKPALSAVKSCQSRPSNRQQAAVFVGCPRATIRRRRNLLESIRGTSGLFGSEFFEPVLAPARQPAAHAQCPARTVTRIDASRKAFGHRSSPLLRNLSPRTTIETREASIRAASIPSRRHSTRLA